MKNLCIVLLAALIPACQTKNTEISYNGGLYIKINNERFIDDTRVKVSMWKRIDPLDTNNWYYPEFAGDEISANKNFRASPNY